jgi:hypothetical protein
MIIGRWRGINHRWHRFHGFEEGLQKVTRGRLFGRNVKSTLGQQSLAPI